MHDERVVARHRAITQVDVDEGRGVAVEPARLYAYGAAGHRPFGAVVRHGHAATLWSEYTSAAEEELARTGGAEKGLHGYSHCMPYGNELFGPIPRPCASGIVPLVFRLSPRQPGYVMTVCEETRVDRRQRQTVLVVRSKRRDESIVDEEDVREQWRCKTAVFVQQL